MTDSNEFLQHFGVLGMKWGIRRSERPTPTGAPRSTDAAARSDAQAFLKAKRSYGTGSGIARRQAQATLTTKSDKSATYRRAAQYHIENEQKLHDIRRKRAVNLTAGLAVSGATLYATAPLIVEGSKAGSRWLQRQITNHKFNKIVKDLV